MEQIEIREAYEQLKSEFSGTGHPIKDVELKFFISGKELFVRDVSPKAIKSALILAEFQKFKWLAIATIPLTLQFIDFLSDEFIENKISTKNFADFLNSYFMKL